MVKITANHRRMVAEFMANAARDAVDVRLDMVPLPGDEQRVKGIVFIQPDGGEIAVVFSMKLACELVKKLP